jgi:hypothetical protein
MESVGPGNRSGLRKKRSMEERDRPISLCVFIEHFIIIITHLLGLAPAGYLAAPDSGARAGCGVVQAKYPNIVTVVTLCH